MEATRTMNIVIAIAVADDVRESWLQIKNVLQCVLLDAVAVPVVLEGVTVGGVARAGQTVGAIRGVGLDDGDALFGVTQVAVVIVVMFLTSETTEEQIIAGFDIPFDIAKHQ